MLKKKPVKEKGKIRLSEYFKGLKAGDMVSIVRELSLATGFPKRLQGRTGQVISKKGEAYIVNINDNKKTKQYIIRAIHLRKAHSSPFHRASETQSTSPLRRALQTQRTGPLRRALQTQRTGPLRRALQTHRS
ncbi:hypothetical protein HYV49_01795 [Candidatus Pacearchaeota archaeon]|nr:hypothetical protein [Candidatus Pacearchaeota archaeon]